MTRTAWIVWATAMAVSACARPTPEQQIVNDAAEALGGSARVQAVKTLAIEGGGTNWNLGQDMTPDASGQTFTLSEYRRTIDVVGSRMRTEQVRTPGFIYFAGPQPQKQIAGIDGSVGYNVAANGTATRVPDMAARDRRVEVYHHPLTIVRAALNPAAKLANPRTQDNQRVVDVTTADGLNLTLAIDTTTNLPARVVSMAYNANLGDVAIETGFADYQDVSGLKLPARLTTKTDRYTTAEIRASKQTIDGAAAEVAAPSVAASAPAVAGPAPATVTVQEIGKGIWLLAGQSHHSVLVEFADHLTLIEAPQNETRTAAVIAKAKELRPIKPLTQIVNTHHHFDHSGGVRTAVADGLAVVTHKGNAPFFENIIARSHTMVPDALSKRPTPLTMETVDEEMELKDATMTVNLYHVAGSPHTDTMLMAYFPREKVLVEADVFSPGSAVNPYAANLLENIKTRQLQVDRIVPIHGQVVPFADLVKATQPPAPAGN